MNKKYITIFFLVVFVGCIFCLTSVCVSAQDADATPIDTSYLSSELALEDNDTAPLADLKLPNVFQVLVRFSFSLFIIIGLIWGVAIIYKRFFSTKYFLGKDADLIKVLAHHYLDPKKSLYVVEIAQKLFVLAAGAETLNVVTEITDPSEIQRIYNILETKSELYGSRDFKKVLAGFGAPEQSSDVKTDKKKAPVSGFKQLQSHLKKLKRIISEK